MREHSLPASDRLDAATAAARAAGAILMDGLGKPHTIRTKSDVTDLLTEIDLRAEAVVVEHLQQAFPQDGFLAEERARRPAGRGTWIIDPLDGTTNYAHGIPFFSVSIAYAEDAGVNLGVVLDPVREELFQAVSGLGAWLNGEPIRVSHTPDLDQSLLTTGFPYNVRTASANNLDHYAALALRTQGVRRLGSAALDLAYVAAGRFDAYWEVRTFPWDVAAGILMVAEAGGRVSEIPGAHPPQFAGDAPVSVLASNGRIHAAMQAALAQGAA